MNNLAIDTERAARPTRIPFQLAQSMLHWSGQLFPLFRKWRQTNRGRRQLEALNEHLLRDIGLSRHDVVRGVQHPFWDREI